MYRQFAVQIAVFLTLYYSVAPIGQAHLCPIIGIKFGGMPSVF